MTQTVIQELFTNERSKTSQTIYHISANAWKALDYEKTAWETLLDKGIQLLEEKNVMAVKA